MCSVSKALGTILTNLQFLCKEGTEFWIIITKPLANTFFHYLFQQVSNGSHQIFISTTSLVFIQNRQIKLKIQAVSLFCADTQLKIPSVLFRVYITYSQRKSIRKNNLTEFKKSYPQDIPGKIILLLLKGILRSWHSLFIVLVKLIYTLVPIHPHRNSK